MRKLNTVSHDTAPSFSRQRKSMRPATAFFELKRVAKTELCYMMVSLRIYCGIHSKVDFPSHDHRRKNATYNQQLEQQGTYGTSVGFQPFVLQTVPTMRTLLLLTAVAAFATASVTTDVAQVEVSTFPVMQPTLYFKPGFSRAHSCFAHMERRLMRGVEGVTQLRIVLQLLLHKAFGRYELTRCAVAFSLILVAGSRLQPSASRRLPSSCLLVPAFICRLSLRSGLACCRQRRLPSRAP